METRTRYIQGYIRRCLVDVDALEDRPEDTYFSVGSDGDALMR
jgi:hypothetical protein